jgi:hypothetical protein
MKREHMKRREFLAVTLIATATVMVDRRRAFAAPKHKYKLAPENLLPKDIRSAPEEVREAYRFAIVNRATLRYIPCYCGCGAQGHTSNASCYMPDNSTPEKLLFDRMSLG